MVDVTHQSPRLSIHYFCKFGAINALPLCECLLILSMKLAVLFCQSMGHFKYHCLLIGPFICLLYSLSSFKTHFDEMVERIRPLIEKSTGEQIRPLVIQKCVPLSHKHTLPFTQPYRSRSSAIQSIALTESTPCSMPSSPAEVKQRVLVPSADISEHQSVIIGSGKGTLLGPLSSNVDAKCEDLELDGLLAANTQTVRTVSRPKRGISAALMERIRRWQAERDRAEGVTRPNLGLRTPRFAVRATTVSSGISDASFTTSERLLEPCLVEEDTNHRHRNTLHREKDSINSLTGRWSDFDETESTSMIPVLAQFIEVQSNPTLCGIPLEGVETNYCGWRPKWMNRSQEVGKLMVTVPEKFHRSLLFDVHHHWKFVESVCCFRSVKHTQRYKGGGCVVARKSPCHGMNLHEFYSSIFDVIFCKRR